MSEAFQSDRWPDYLPLPHDDVFAIGVITLNYGQLESMFRTLLSGVAQWNEFQTGAVFHRLPNNNRLDVLSELLTKTQLPDETKEDVRHFMAGFSACADSRNLIMHSSSAGQHRGGLVLQRYSKAGARLECYLTFDHLKKIADDIYAFATFGACVDGDVRSFAMHFQRGHPEDYRGRTPLTLQKKPPLPSSLNWSAPTDSKGQKFPHSASLLLQAFRMRDDL